LTLRETKFLRERLAMDFLASEATDVNSSFARDLKQIWLEFESGKTDASHVARDLDKLECVSQAVVYEKRSRLKKNLDDFLPLLTDIRTPILKQWAEHLRHERAALWSRESPQILVIFIIGK
jgi:5'-deoxynucleotidase YfbR-like HD superfamily hydrolase